MVSCSRQTIATIVKPALMHSTRSVLSPQSRFRHHATASDTFRFFDLLTSPDLFDALEASLPEHRERLFPPTETLSMFMAQALKPDRSCQGIVDDVAVKRLLHGLPLCSTKTGAYCKARQRLPLSMVSGMVTATGQLIAGKVPAKWRWHGRRVRLVDGTTVTLPDTPANQATYPQQAGQKAGLGFPICRIVGLSCLAGGALLNAAMGNFKGKGSGEQGLLRSLLDTLEAIIFPLFNYTPKLYLWIVRKRMAKLYRRLRVVEKELQTELSPVQAKNLSNELEDIDRAASFLGIPIGHLDLFFSLKTHINLIRSHLGRVDRVHGVEKAEAALVRFG